MSATEDLLVIGLGVLSITVLLSSIWHNRRQAERMRRQLEAVEAAEGEVRRLLDELPEAVLLVDSDHIVHSTNAAALALFDLAREQMIESDLLEHADGDEQVQLAAAIQRAFEGDEVDPIQVEVHGGATRRVVVEASFHLPRHSAVFDQARRLVVRLRDVSEREQQTRALDQARRRFHQAFQSAPTGMALVRLDDGRIVDANQSLAEMLRREVNELVGCTLREFTHPDDVRAAQPHRARLELGIDRPRLCRGRCAGSATPSEGGRGGSAGEESARELSAGRVGHGRKNRRYVRRWCGVGQAGRHGKR